MAAGAPKKARRSAKPALTARLGARASLEARATGEIVATIQGYAMSLGSLGTAAADGLKKLRAGLPIADLDSDSRAGDRETRLLVARLANLGLLEFRLGGAEGEELAVIEPQTRDYWPRTLELKDDDRLVLSRFAYLRRRGVDMVLESPRAAALFRICSPETAAALTALARPRQVKELRRQNRFPGLALLGLLLDCQMLFKTDAADGAALRRAEGDDQLVLWDFHDLLFHARSTEGRHANLLGGVYPHAGAIAPLPAVRPSWPGKKLDLPPPQALSHFAELLRRRRSVREFDERDPITLDELSTLLDRTARVLARWSDPVDIDDGGHTSRPYPTAGAAYELELYLAVARCEGLKRGFYHYDAGAHALAPIDVQPGDLETMLIGAAPAMGVAVAPQILVTISARFGRISWKYSSIAYSLILKDVGALSQTFYLAATDMGLGGCAIGITNLDIFARVTGLELHAEGPVGQFALGRGLKS